MVLIVLGSAAPIRAQTLASGAEIRGWVVNAETRQPLEGVHVVALTSYWTLVSPLQMHEGEHTTLHISEAVTGTSGEYYIPAWGPKLRPINAFLDDLSPRLTYFRPGYRLLGRSNSGAPDTSLSRTSTWSGHTMELEPFRGTPEECARSLRGLQGSLGWRDEGGAISLFRSDHWKQVPRTELTILEERRQLPARVRPGVLDVNAATEAEMRKRVGQGASSR